MENAPAFQFYPKDWLVLTEGFPTESFGFILKTVCFLWVSETQGMIENDDETIAFTLGSDVEKWQSVKRMAIKKGVFKENEDGFLVCPYILKTLEKQAEKRTVNAENGKKGGRPKTENNPTVSENKTVGSENKANESPSSSSSTSTASSTAKIYSPLPPKGESEVFPGFDKFWEVYPAYGSRKTDKSECLNRWKKRKLENLADEIIKSVELHKKAPDWKKEGGQYIPAPLAFINKSKWEAEVSTPQYDATYAPRGTIIV